MYSILINAGRIILVIVLLSTFGCKPQIRNIDYILTSQEKAICDSLQIDTSIISDIRSVNKNEIERFHYSLSKSYTKDSVTEIDPIFLNGLVLNETNENSYDLVLSLKDKFRLKGYSIFLLENNFNINGQLDRVAVLKTTDKYTVLTQIQTDGINYDITNDSLISIIKTLDKRFSLELIGASGDWCEFIIHNEPNDWKLFAEEIYKLCPDIVDQGTGTVQALADELRNTKRLYFWWD